MIHRRSFITGLVSLVAAPAIVRAGSLMPVKVMIEPPYGIGHMMHALPFIRRDMGLSVNRSTFVTAFFRGQECHLLEIDRCLIDRLGPEYRAAEEQRMMSQLSG